MLTQLIKSTTFFQLLLSSQFRTLKQHFVNTLVFLSTCHLFGLTNPNQVSDAFSIPKARLYRELNTMSLYLWQHLFVRIGCSIALEAIREVVSKSAASLSRLRIVITMFKEVVSFFEETGIDIRNYPITFDSWYGSRHLIDTLREMGFETILVHGKSNYVMTIDEKRAKLSEHKKSIELLSNQ